MFKANSFALKSGLCALCLISVVWVSICFIDQEKERYSTHYDYFSSSQTTYGTTNTSQTEALLYETKPTAEQTTKLERATIKPISQCQSENYLVGQLKIDYDEIQRSYHQFNNQTKPALTFEPVDCIPRRSIAIIIPYRDRRKHLEYLLGHIRPILERQRNKYQIFVVEQVGNGTFNKGRLMNTGFEFARKKYGVHFDCYVFHDVDMLAENDKISYSCNDNKVNHLACTVNKFKYDYLCCGITVGGVIVFPEQKFIEVNGYPNNYWGWGGEDDDMYARIRKKKIPIERPEKKICRYTMITHKRDKLNNYDGKAKVQERVNAATKVMDENGLSNLQTTVLNVKHFPLYVHINVDVGTRNRSETARSVRAISPSKIFQSLQNILH